MARNPVNKPEPGNPAARPPRPFLPSAPAPLPEVIEDDSEASWELWREANKESNSWDADTVPMDLPRD